MIAFVIITAFIVINLIIAVICDAIAALHANEKAMIQGINSADQDDDADEEPHVHVKKQLQTLEQQVEELSRMQQQTMHSLQYLTRHLQAKRTPS
jgi:septal ring factor EnvC (AmiA/AmiB activator)